MSSFTEPLLVEYIDGKNWKLIKEFSFYFYYKNKKITITVPTGFITDFASIPRIFWSLLPPTGKYGKAAVIHDYCYRKRLLPRKLADKVFLEAMKVLKVARWKIYIMYLAVRLFGWRYYGKKHI